MPDPGSNLHRQPIFVLHFMKRWALIRQLMQGRGTVAFVRQPGILLHPQSTSFPSHDKEHHKTGHGQKSKRCRYADPSLRTNRKRHCDADGVDTASGTDVFVIMLAVDAGTIEELEGKDVLVGGRKVLVVV